ncbi:hypothetical protein IEE92_13455 [Kocuria sp. cx-116]|uniref:hypothetical protein n=1 Tax=Kocuria sp. cx-116 TaxID=2771378 RepID=UPI00168266A9|nr:hypothetical protein [Kocuria sp. cx-116]MBD2763535.1 hypothetical protein [Kocuria sp. cx-116]
MSGFHDTPEVDVLEHDGKQGVTAPHAAWELGAALADNSVPVDDRDGVAVAQFLRMAADAWVASKTEEAADRALERVRFLRLLERGAGVALHDAVDDARGSGASWAGVGWALNTSRQSPYERFTG